MKQMEVTDELLYQYMPIAYEMDLDALEAEIADEEIVLSKKFERRMKRLMWKEEHKWVAGFGKFMARVAVVMLCVLGVSLAVTMSVDAYRSKFFQTVQEIWEDSVVHTYDTDRNEQEFVVREPTYIPDGYVEVERYTATGRLSIVYVNAELEYIYWDQIFIQQEELYVIDSEYLESSTYKIKNGLLTLYYHDEAYITAYYETKEYVYILDADNLSIEEIIKVFESI